MAWTNNTIVLTQSTIYRSVAYDSSVIELQPLEQAHIQVEVTAGAGATDDLGVFIKPHIPDGSIDTPRFPAWIQSAIGNVVIRKSFIVSGVSRFKVGVQSLSTNPSVVALNYGSVSVSVSTTGVSPT